MQNDGCWVGVTLSLWVTGFAHHVLMRLCTTSSDGRHCISVDDMFGASNEVFPS